MADKLTPKQQAFVQEYLVDLNGTQAAIRAGYSKDTANVIASENLTKPNIKALVEKRLQERAERTQVTQDMIVSELKKIAFADIRNAVEWGISPVDDTDVNADKNGLGMYPVKLVPSSKIDDDTAAAVSEVSLTQAGVKIKMHDKKAALVDLGKHLGMFVDKIDHSSSDGSMSPKSNIDPTKLSPEAMAEILAAQDEASDES